MQAAGAANRGESLYKPFLPAEEAEVNVTLDLIAFRGHINGWWRKTSNDYDSSQSGSSPALWRLLALAGGALMVSTLGAYSGPGIESSLLVLFKRLATCDLVSASFR